ncbi:hypothetical protein [Nocardia brevicatena]|uniref:hypothetical protein n=1 Tax=Nocardia brevicatena TaxID=37327 RepID=UPI0002F1559A|nr:hypothetical protein [Nocardia brevicatena]
MERVPVPGDDRIPGTGSFQYHVTYRGRSMATSSQLPRRLVRVDFGNGRKYPTVAYTAPPDVIARFLTALRLWNPEYKAEVEPIDNPDDNVPPMPTWRLWAWD